MNRETVCLLPEIKSVGGPAAFQQRFITAAAKQGITAHFDSSRKDIGAYLVIGAPRKFIPTLYSARQRGIPVIQRLNGMNWIHRVRPSGRLYGEKADLANNRLSFFRKHIATGIVYQSPFCETHWNEVYGVLSDKPSRIIYNGVDLNEFKPIVPEFSSEDIEILIVEGNLEHGSEQNLEQALSLSMALSRRTSQKVHLRIAGNVPEAIREKVFERMSDSTAVVSVDFLGIIEKSRLIELENSSHMLFSVELNPACPNSVIEALACGLPVIGFDTGALKDVTGVGGIIVPYGTDVWKLEKPILFPLIDAAEKVYRENQKFRKAARKQAESHFSIDKITEEYLSFLFGS